MGQEIKCRVEFGKEKSEGKALLETSEVLFRGGFRLKIPFQSITAMEAAGGKLKIQFGEGSAVFHLGPAAEKWGQDPQSAQPVGQAGCKERHESSSDQQT